MNLRGVLALVPTLSLLVLAGCGERERVGPTTPSTDSGQLLASATIGAEGGTVAGDELEVTVPAGAFSGATELRIYRSSDDQPFSGSAVSQLYRLDGLPATFGEPLVVSFPAVGTETGPMVALGETSFSCSDNAMTTGYRMLESAPSDSSLAAFIPAAPDFADDSDQGVSVHLVHLSGYSSKIGSARSGVKTTSTDHFRILHVGQNAEVAQLGTYLEDAYSKLESWGFSYSARSKWPVQVIVNDLKAGRYGEFVPSMWGNNQGFLTFNALYLDQAPEMKATAGHEFFHLVQSLYDTRNRFPKSKLPSDRYWLDEACSVWSEREWMGDPEFLSTGARDGHQRLPFHHFHVSAFGDHPDYHGYGMSALIQYISDRAGTSTLGAIYDYIRAHGNDPVAAVTSVMADRLHEEFGVWHPDFMERLIQGELYSDVNNTIAVAYDTDTWDITDGHDTRFIRSNDYEDGAARFYIVKLRNPAFASEAELNISLDPSVGTIKLFEFHGSTTTLLDSGPSASVGRLDELTAAGQNLTVMTIYSHLGIHHNDQHSMTLDMKILDPKEFDGGAIILSGLGTYTIVSTDPDTTWTQLGGADLVGGPSGGTFVLADGSMGGSVFTAHYDAYDGYVTRVGDISITVDNPEDPTMITEFQVSGRVVQDVSFQEFSYSGDCAVPVASVDGQSYYFRLTDGVEDCLHDVAAVSTRFDGRKTATLTHLANPSIQVVLAEQ